MTKIWDREKHLKELATVIEGSVVDDRPRVEVCIKGSTLGFASTIEAIGTGFPFGVSFFMVTDVLGENRAPGKYLTISPKVVQGFLAKFSRILLLDGGAVKVGDSQFDQHFILRTSDSMWSRAFIKYPGMMRKLSDLFEVSKFSEFHFREKQGICVVQSQCLEDLSTDQAREVFRAMAPIAQVIFDVF